MKNCIANIRISRFARLALIPSLGMVLITVLLWRPSDEIAELSSEPAPGVLVSKKTADSVHKHPEHAWPTMDIDEVVSFDPFDPLRSQAPTTIAGNLESTAAEVQTNSSMEPSKRAAFGKLQAVYIDSRGAAAMFESRIVHVGDQIDGGGRVVAINGREIIIDFD